MGKRGYLFTLDAFIATIVLGVGTSMIFTTMHSHKPFYAQAHVYSEDLMTVFASTKISEYKSGYVKGLIDAGQIINYDNTLLDQLGEFSENEEFNLINEFIEDVIGGTVATNYNVKFTIKNEDRLPMHTYISWDDDDIQMDNADIIMTSKRVIFGLINEGDAWGPYTVDIQVWI